MEMMSKIVKIRFLPNGFKLVRGGGWGVGEGECGSESAY